MAEEVSDEALKKVQEVMRAEAKAVFEAEYKERASASVPQPSEDDQARKEFKKLIDPIYKNEIDEAKLTSAEALDYAKFYNRSNEDAFEYQDQVEAMFERLKSAGRPMSRIDILDYIVGNEKRTSPEKYQERETKRTKAALDKARDAEDMAGFGSSRLKDDIAKFANFESKTLEEMEAALEGIVF